MQRRRRLTGAKHFLSIHQQGAGWADRLLVLKALPNGLEQSRFGFATGRRLGKAVVRNRVKRRLREGVRLTSVRSGWDALFIARRDAASADFHQLMRSLVKLLKRADLLAPPGPGSDT